MISGRVVLCFPWRPTPEREAIFRILRVAYGALGLPLVIADSDPDRSFNLAQARNRAAELAGDWDVAAFIDADTWVEPLALRRMIRTARSTRTVVFPTEVYCLAEDQTTVEATLSHVAGGLIVVPRCVWEIVGGFDERFVAWGYEDMAFDFAATTLVAAHLRVSATIHVFHHPRSPDDPWYSGSPRPPLFDAYLAADGHVDAMRELTAASAAVRVS